jgi:N-acetylmuramoyl-L-alanine amidase
MIKNIKSKKVAAFLAMLTLSFTLGQAANAATYTVASGDTLSKIGSTFNTSSATLMSANKLSSQAIYPGQKLYIPSIAHTVKSGDTLYLISKGYNVTLYSLRKANNVWSDLIYPGQILQIPGKTASATTTATTLSQPSRGSTSNAAIPYTASDLDLLARLITAEAENQPYSAKVAVGSTVINRVQDSRYPNTLKGVIYQVDGGYYQFSPVLNGWINKPASQEAKRAAYDALHGSDPTKGALYYFDDSTKNKWLWSKTIALRSGNMVFTYYK